MVYVRRLLAGLRERGHEVEIVSRLNVRNLWRGRVAARRIVTEAISVRKAMKRFAPDAWLVYGAAVQNPDLFGWWQHPKRYVHINTNTGRGDRLPRWWRRLLWFVHTRSLARADAVAAERPTHADNLRSFGIAEERLSLFPPVLEAWDWMPSREESRRRLELPQEAAIILCVSRLSEEKTQFVLDLVNAVAKLPSDVLLVLVGDGPGRERVEHRVAELRLDGHVRVAGFVPHDDVRWFYAACDSFAYPDPVDRMSLAILEAQACGRPVVAMATSSVALIVDPGRTGLLAKDLDEFQGHLAALASDKALCDSMGQAGPEYVAEFHSLEARIRDVEDLLLLGREDVKVGTVRLEALKAKEIERLTDGEGYEAYIRPGELYWRIHFAPFGKPKKDPARSGRAVYLAYSDMLKVIRWLGRKMERGQLDGATAIVATSRAQMAAFAIKRFGFHRVAGYKHHRGFVKVFVRTADLVGRESGTAAVSLSLAKKYRRS